MSVTVSPLELLLDVQNPRFVILANREQADIRKYLITYEDVCQLAVAINNYGSLLPGERIVVIQENDQYIVVEGNRRTCCLQLLLSRDLIPNGFEHRIPIASAKLLENCGTIEVDVLTDRNAALELMTKRHIEGVKQWKPLAKKQFFAANYNNGDGQSISTLSDTTGIPQSTIKDDIREYKFFSSVYEKYVAEHPEFNREIVVLKTDPFWRIFKAKFTAPTGETVSPKDFLKISYDALHNTVSSLPNGLFDRIAQLVFEEAIVQEQITTRNTLSDVNGIRPLLDSVVEYVSLQTEQVSETDNTQNDSTPGIAHERDTSESEQIDSTENAAGVNASGNLPVTQTSRDNHQEIAEQQNIQTQSVLQTGGPQPGGPAPRTFFETISWHGKLDPAKAEHQGLLHAINELFNLSTLSCNRQKVYKSFPIATGMVLRAVYEQALRLRMIQTRLWGTYLQQQNGAIPTLSTIESFIGQQNNKQTLFPDRDIVAVFDNIIRMRDRAFLNANIHSPGNINVTADSLESMAAGGMFALIQWIIHQIN